MQCMLLHHSPQRPLLHAHCNIPTIPTPVPARNRRQASSSLTVTFLRHSGAHQMWEAWTLQLSQCLSPGAAFSMPGLSCWERNVSEVPEHACSASAATETADTSTLKNPGERTRDAFKARERTLIHQKAHRRTSILPPSRGNFHQLL